MHFKRGRKAKIGGQGRGKRFNGREITVKMTSVLHHTFILYPGKLIDLSVSRSPPQSMRMVTYNNNPEGNDVDGAAGRSRGERDSYKRSRETELG